MKKVVSILVLVLAFSFTTQAQRKHKKGNFEKLTSEQKATLGVKKMALALDLSDAQQRQVKPLLKQQMEERKAAHAKMKAAKEAGKKPTADQRFKMQNTRLDKQLAFQNRMKKILNDEQFEKFKKMKRHMKGKMKKQMKKGKGKKQRKNRR